MKLLSMMLAIILAAAIPASAQIPRLMNYQGVLTDDMGSVVSDGTYSMTFRIYDVPSGSTPLWEETFDVIVSKGIFNAVLGYTTPIDLAFDEPLYLGLSVSGGAELSPRRLFASNAHAFSARSVFGAENVFPSSGNVGIGATDPDAPLTIRINNTDSNAPALLIENTGDQSVIDFKMATVTQARIRKAAGGDLFLGTLVNNGLSFMLNGALVSRMLPDGSFGVGTLSPLEKLDVAGALRLGSTANSNAGTIRWTGTDFEGYDGGSWLSLTSGGGSGLPSGSSGNTLRHDGADWAAAGNLTNTGTYIGINTSSPAYPLHVVQPSGQVGMRVDGHDGSWASIYVNAATAPGNPNYGYMRQNVLYGSHHVGSDYSWNLRLNNTDAMHVEPNGWTAFGNIPLAESMNIPGALRLGNASGSNAGTIRYTGSDFEGYVGGAWNSLTAGGLPAGTGGQTLRYDGGWTAAGNLYNNGTDIGIGTTSPSSNLHIYENVNGLMGIRIENPNTGSGSGEEISFVDENGQVAGIRLYDDTSPSSYAGSMAISNNRPSGSILLRTGGLNRIKLHDDGRLDLPTGAVSAGEIADEPGAVSYTANTTTTIASTLTVLASQTLNAPASGYVLVIATCQGQVGHVNGAVTSVDFGVSDDGAAFPDNQDVSYYFAPGAATGTYTAPVTCHGLFQVAAGANTFYFLGRKTSDSFNAYALDKQLTAIFIPTGYGTVMPTLASGAPSDEAAPKDNGMTEAEIADTRSRSLEADNARIRRELEEMRTRLEAIEASLGDPARE